MTNEHENLENELSRMRPRAIPPALLARVEADLTASRLRLSWSDRFLLSSVVGGAMAACVIVGMFLNGVHERGTNLEAPARVTVNRSLLPESRMALASADPEWTSLTR